MDDPGKIDVQPLPCDFLKTVLEQTNDGIYYVNKDRRILFWNKGAERITGYQASEVIGRLCYDGVMCHIDDNGRRTCQGDCPLDVAISGRGEHRQRRLYLKSKEGRRVPVDVVGTPVHDEKGELVGALEIFRDATAYEETERSNQVITKLASTDSLTGLFNRRQIEIELELEVKRSRRLGLPISVLYGDVDYFKIVNDTLGHGGGDQVLMGVAQALQKGLRPYDRLARIGGDEFLIVLPETTVELAAEIAERLRRSIETHEYRGLSLTKPATMSFGVAELAKDESPEALVARADQALYKAKKSGRNGVFVF
jgi:diguanylate cyclase (GGDEF)-like protein/PAS domain S-box-containing protein